MPQNPYHMNMKPFPSFQQHPLNYNYQSASNTRAMTPAIAPRSRTASYNSQINANVKNNLNEIQLYKMNTNTSDLVPKEAEAKRQF